MAPATRLSRLIGQIAQVSQPAVAVSTSPAAASESTPGALQRAIPESPSVVLSRTGSRLPLVGLGTWKAEPGVVAAAVEEAIRIGYRHIDCACDYGNEQEVGEGIRKSIEAGIVQRVDLFITSKLWNTYHRKEHVRPACERSLSDLGLDYLDLYLIHFPIPLKYVPFETRYPPEWIHDPTATHPKMELDDEVTLDETWRAMEQLVDAGLVRNIGVCNFRVQLLQHLRRVARIQPQVNQVELHPFLVQEQLVRYCEHVGIAVTGFSPLGSGSYVQLGMATAKDSVLGHPTVCAIAERCGRTPAQVVLRWATQRGYSVVPKSTKKERLAENLALFEFSLTSADMKAISDMDCGRRFNDPGVFCLDMGAFCPIYG